MSNLKGSGNNDIGLNYKSILSIGTASDGLGTVSATLQTVTDGDGNTTPFQLSSTQVKIQTINQFIIDTGSIYGSHPTYASQYHYIIDNNGGTFNMDAVGSGTYHKWLINGSSKMQLQNAGLVIGGTLASAKLHVRGDGTNPIARFDSSVGVDAFEFRQTSSFKIGTLNNYMWMSTAGGGNPVATGEMMEFYSDTTYQSNPNFKFRSYNNRTNTAGIASILQIGSTTFGATAGSANFIPLNIQYIINNSGAQTGTATGIFLNATETALNGMTHRLIDLQVGGTSKMYLTSTGIMYVDYFKAKTGYVEINAGQAFQIDNRLKITNGASDGIALITNYGGTDFNRLQLGGTTNAFPSLKRNGSEIQARLADDSAPARLECSQMKVNNGVFLISNVALTNGAAAGAGTITNAPAAGNPTKWIPIDDNGTTRYIPCW